MSTFHATIPTPPPATKLLSRPHPHHTATYAHTTRARVPYRVTCSCGFLDFTAHSHDTLPDLIVVVARHARVAEWQSALDELFGT